MNEPNIPAYISRKRAAHQLDMSPDTFDNYVRKGILPPPKRRGKLMRWKWAEISNVLDGGNLSVVQSSVDPYDLGVERAKAANGRAADSCAPCSR
jgi:predicted DNA-binding transcriptional regulator AlpA